MEHRLVLLCIINIEQGELYLYKSYDVRIHRLQKKIIEHAGAIRVSLARLSAGFFTVCYCKSNK